MFKRGSMVLVVTVVIGSLNISVLPASADLLQNMDFDTNLDGWTIGGVDNLGTWDVQWSEEHGGSAKMYISGSPAAVDISQNTQIAIMPGDQITINVFHTDMGNFSHWVLELNGSDILSAEVKSEGDESLTWTADQEYDSGTLLTVGCSVWPGSSTTWVKSIVYVPEPATLSLLALGGLALLRRKRGYGG